MQVNYREAHALPVILLVVIRISSTLQNQLGPPPPRQGIQVPHSSSYPIIYNSDNAPKCAAFRSTSPTSKSYVTLGLLQEKLSSPIS